MDTFEDCWLRIERAERHAESDINAWKKVDTSKAYKIFPEVKSDGTGELFIEPISKSFKRISLELGEMLYQLNAALDGAVYQCAVIEKGHDPPPNEEKILFPFLDSKGNFRSDRISPLPDDLRTFIRSLQRDMIGKGCDNLDPIRKGLQLLNEWARADRHRRLHPILLVPSDIVIECITHPVDFIDILEVASENKAKIANFRISGFDGRATVEMELRSSLNIGIKGRDRAHLWDFKIGEQISFMVGSARKIVERFETDFGC